MGLHKFGFLFVNYHRNCVTGNFDDLSKEIIESTLVIFSIMGLCFMAHFFARKYLLRNKNSDLVVQQIVELKNEIGLFPDLFIPHSFCKKLSLFHSFVITYTCLIFGY